MSETQTPAFDSAPWRANRLSSEDGIDGSSAVWASDGDLVASVHPGIGGTRMERGIDRARLIAAAPDMLKALKLCKHQIQEIASQAGHDPGVYKAYTMAEDALASAEGSENEQ